MQRKSIDNLLERLDEKSGDYLIENVVSKQDYVILEINKNKIKCSYDDYLNFALRPNKYIDEELYQKIKNSQDYLLAYNSALRKVSGKDYSIYKLKQSLRQKYDLSDEDLNKIVNKLKSINLLNDERYVQNKLLVLSDGVYSKKQIYSKLLKDGINKDLIDKHYVVQDEYEKVFSRANKYLKGSKGKSINYLKQNIQTKLLNDGYKYEDVIKAINNLQFEEVKSNEYDNCLKQATKLNLKYSKKYSGYELNKYLYTNLSSKGFRSEDINKALLEMGLK